MNTGINKNISFEFFPPKTEKGIQKLEATRNELIKLKPEFFSVTFGAGGSTRDRTYDTVIDIQKNTSIDAAPHLSCISNTKDEIRDLINRYKEAGVKRIVALRGDRPSGMGSGEIGEMKHANELVEFIRQETGDHFTIEVACYPEVHPEAKSPQADLENFKKKVDAGANSAISQYFYNADSYFHFVANCEKLGINIPIIPGIMPITNYAQLARFSDACGAEIPRWVRQQLQAYGDDIESIKSFGLDVVSELCRKLLDAGVPGLHFYTMNQAEPTLKIWNNIFS